MEAPPETLREHCASRLPTFRTADLQKLGRPSTPPPPAEEEENRTVPGSEQHAPATTTTKSRLKPRIIPQIEDPRNQTATSFGSRDKSQIDSVRHNTNSTSSTSPSTLISNSTLAQLQQPRHLDVSDPAATQTPRRIYPATATASRNTSKHNGPPLSMITQGYSRDFESQALESDSTSTWVESMSLTTTTLSQPSPATQTPLSSPPGTDNHISRPLIKPIRGFKPSSRKSIEMSSRRTSRDADDTLRALEGFDGARSHRNSNSQQQQQQIEQDEQTVSDESDLFLRAAREEEKSARQNATVAHAGSPGRSDSRRSRIGQRSSLPPSSVVVHSSIPHRRGSDQESSNGVRPMEEQEGVAQALTYRPTAKDRPTAPEEMNRNRFLNNSRSNPSTPRARNSREISPESQASQVSYGPRRSSISDATPPVRTSYRQSNLSYTTPRTYNSSPLVSRSTDMHAAPETPRAAEGTESSVSTTAPSTVWDELEDLKSRIHRLELTGKIPPTSGAAMSRASNDRPPTATTTVTTLSSSPKRGRGNSISQDGPIDAENPTETHPLLRAALTNTKTVLNSEIYKALEAATSDALAISSMMGSSGQPGPISSSQSTIGGPAAVSDRQVRRKADSLCRNLTELCLALSEAKPEHAGTVTIHHPISHPTLLRPANEDTTETRISTEPTTNSRQLVTTDLSRAKSSPRALSRLEARRSSLLATSILPSPRYAPSESGTPTQTGRRTSMFLRTRRAGTEEPEEEDEPRFRAPSRANTEVGRLRNSPREYTSQQPLPSPTVQSSLPIRRHYNSTSLTNTTSPPMPPISNLGGRRFLDRSTPDRDTGSVVSRLADDRGQRKSSIGGVYGLSRTGSLTRKTRQVSESPTAGQAGNYQ